MKHSIHCKGYRGRDNDFDESVCDCKHIDSAFVKDAAVKILAGLLANPVILQHDPNCGWRLCNCTPRSLGEYAWHVARELEAAQESTE